MNIILKERLTFTAVGLFLLGFIIIGISGVVPPLAYDPSTQMYRAAKRPMQTQILLYEQRHACWILGGMCFATSAVLALIVTGKKKRIAEHAPPAGRGEAPRP